MLKYANAFRLCRTHLKMMVKDLPANYLLFFPSPFACAHFRSLRPLSTPFRVRKVLRSRRAPTLNSELPGLIKNTRSL